MDNTKKVSCLGVVIWFALAAFFFYQFIARSSFITVLTNEFMQYFRIDAAGIGLLGSCYYLVYTLMQIPAGIIVDKYSCRSLATMAASLCPIGLYLLIATQNGYVAGIGEMLMGFSASFSFILLIKAATMWFPADKIAMLTAFSISIGCLGPVIGGPIVARIVKSFDWLDVIKTYCVIGIVLAIFIGIVVKDKDNSNKKSSDSNLFETIKTIASSKQVWVLALLTMTLYAPLSALGDMWGVMFIKTVYGLDSESAALANNMLYLGMVVGSPIIAYAATVCGSYKKPMICGISGAFISICIIVYLSDYINTFMLFVLLFAVGFFCGAMLTYPLGLAIFPKSIGATVTGFINMASMVSGVILMPAIGGIMQYFWNGEIVNGVKVYTLSNYRMGLTSVVLFLGLGVILSFFVKDKSPNEN